MKSATIRIWMYTELLHSEYVEFKTIPEINSYALGLFNGLKSVGLEPTGIETEMKLTINTEKL